MTSKAERSELLTMGVPSIGIFLLSMMIMTTTLTLLNPTLEESINRTSEFPRDRISGRTLCAAVGLCNGDL